MNLIVLGPQGSGKGTQAEKLAQKFNLIHIDMGNALRQLAMENTDLGKETHEIVNVRKELVPFRITKSIIHFELGSIPRKQGVIFDGVPRNIDQMGYFEKALLEFARKVDKVIYLKLSKEESLKRISKRLICDKCKRVYILGKDIKDEKEKCADCGGQLVQRMDDTEEGINKRLKIFYEETVPVIEHYKEQGKLVEIKGEQNIEQVFEEILSKL